MQIDTRPSWTPDIDQLRRTVGDSALRKKCLRELERFDREIELVKKLNSIRQVQAAYDELAPTLADFPNQGLIVRAVDEFAEDARKQLQETLPGWLADGMAVRLEPAIKSCLLAAIERIDADVETLRNAGREVAERYPGAPQDGASELERGLTEAQNVLRAENEKPFKLSWHFQPRMPLSGYFTEPL
jgi:hypothetical protein